tara:strand:+ start:4125 stop:4901 length:777 start_codon:yes stop_codon:yes gene_type:complete
MLVNSLFEKYLAKYKKGKGGKLTELSDIDLLNSASPDSVRTKHGLKAREQEIKLQKLKNVNGGIRFECPEDDFTYIIGIVPSVPDMSMNNDVSSHRNLQIMAELRHVLRHDREAKARVYVFLSAETFLAAHRSWCKMLATQTANRASCELVLLSSVATHTIIFTQVLEMEKCLHDFILLHDAAHISPSFLTRIQGTSRHKVTCLAAMTVQNHCPVTAFRLPRVFLIAWVNKQQNASVGIEKTAMEFHLWGGGVTAVGT